MNGTLFDQPKYPTFSKEIADPYFTQKYGQSVTIDNTKLNWFPYIPVDNITDSFNLSPVKPKDIKGILQHKTSNSAPGPDGIGYGILKKFACTHRFLATLFSKILEDGTPPTSWTDSNIKLLYKKGETDCPGNFRMIALASAIGKLYHQVLAERLDIIINNNNKVICIALTPVQS